MIVDLHTHTFFSDGLLIPSELARTAKTSGYSGIAITDHGDISNYKMVLDSLQEFKSCYNSTDDDFKVLAGIEITHVRPANIGVLTDKLRKAGADIVIVHGETLTEPVEKGTNRAAIEAGVDILAHPGLVSREDALLAAEKGVCLEITSRKGHAYTNGHVVNMARMSGAELVFCNDAHSPSDLVSEDFALNVLTGAGLDRDEAFNVIKKSADFFKSLLNR